MHTFRRLLVVLFAMLVVAPFAAPHTARSEPTTPPVTRPQRPRPLSTASLMPTVNSPAITEVGRLGGEGQYRAVAVSGTRAYVGVDTGLRIFDISNPAHPVPLGYVSVGGRVADVQVRGNLAFVVTGDPEDRYDKYDSPPTSVVLYTIDTSAPRSPRILGQYEIGLNKDMRLKVSGDFVYVMSNFGFNLVDVHDPANLTSRSQLAIGSVHDLDVIGNVAYTALDDGLGIFDVSNPDEPTLLGSYDQSRSLFLAVTVIEGLAYVVTHDQGLVVLDVHDPAMPVQRGSFAQYLGGSTASIQVMDNIAYVSTFYADTYSTSGTLSVIDPSNLARPVRRGATNGTFGDVQIVHNLAYVANAYRGLTIFDVADPARITVQGTYNAPDYVPDVQVVGDRAYLAANTEGLQIVDVQNPQATAPIASYATGQGILDVDVLDNRAFIANRYDEYQLGFQIVDVSDPLSPTLLGGYQSGFETRAFDVVGTLAYISARDFTIVDVSNPVSPTLRGKLPNFGAASVVKVAGSFAYVGGSRFSIIDVSNPRQPVLRGRYDTGAAFTGIAVVGSLAYLANTYGLDIVDISDPSKPTLRGYYDLPSELKRNNDYSSLPSSGIQIVGNLAYIGSDTGGLRILDISAPATPQLRATYDLPTYALQVVDNLVYVGGNGLHVLRVDPTRFGFYQFLPLVQK